MHPLDQTYRTSAGRVAAETAGDGPPRVLAHGWPWASASWNRALPLLTDIRCPTTVLWGEDTPWIARARGGRLTRRIGQGPLRCLAEPRHLPRREAPDRVATARLDALTPRSEVA